MINNGYRTIRKCNDNPVTVGSETGQNKRSSGKQGSFHSCTGNKCRSSYSICSKADNKDGQSAGNQNAEQQQAANEKVKKAVEQLNRNMPHSEAVFGIHDGTNRVMIKIVDKDTKEVIKEFPPEETLDMIEKVWELAGIMVDERR